MVTPPWTGERPRASGVSDGQSRQARTCGSPRSRMLTFSLRRTSQDPGRTLGSCRLSAKAPCARSHECTPPKTRAKHGCSCGGGHHPQPVPACSARRTPALRRFTPSQSRRLDGALPRTVVRGARKNKRYKRGRRRSAPLLREWHPDGLSPSAACVGGAVLLDEDMVSRVGTAGAGQPAVALLYARTSNVLDTFRGRRRRLKRSLPDGWRPRCAYVAPHHTVPARGRG